MKITAVLFVPSVEEALAFWVDRIGFEKTMEVPHFDHIGFAILVNDGAELMLQSHSSAEADAPALGEAARASKSSLFIEVPDIQDISRRLEGYTINMPLRDTFYGMREIGVTAPGGHTVVFAARIQEAQV